PSTTWRRSAPGAARPPTSSARRPTLPRPDCERHLPQLREAPRGAWRPPVRRRQLPPPRALLLLLHLQGVRARPPDQLPPEPGAVHDQSMGRPLPAPSLAADQPRARALADPPTLRRRPLLRRLRCRRRRGLTVKITVKI